ncbi:hypothetical protein X768_16630 [Mesorhizobium sp. LSJC265A00]|uniref:DUF3768 domain-containing protein n=1 Tax=Mesorhizobium sp. LSJC265A00 TaxID=1287322 RepID=UPI0003CF8CF0|nr:DUF3768 domain-containing protein [Mesorhizobium sp. LSJC265A00]ESX09918.1 hypothetical protein X768_16630 [Mesorhizobium sp. LSJC265A00]
MTDTAPEIRRLNDAFRRSFIGGYVVVTSGVAALADTERRALLRSVRAFEAFDTDNDPHAEHDFGAIDLEGSKFFWKIDYYGADMNSGSPDPSDPALTRRALTVMRAEEY